MADRNVIELTEEYYNRGKKLQTWKNESVMEYLGVDHAGKDFQNAIDNIFIRIRAEFDGMEPESREKLMDWMAQQIAKQERMTQKQRFEILLESFRDCPDMVESEEERLKIREWKKKR